jgi:hypothetical protein
MSLRPPDLSTLHGILEDVAPRPNEMAEREQAEKLAANLNYEFGERTPVTFGGDNPGGETHEMPAVTVSRETHARQVVAAAQHARAEVPVTYGSPGHMNYDRVAIDRIGNLTWIDASAEAFRAMIIARNPGLQIGITPERFDVTTRVLNNQTGQWE